MSSSVMVFMFSLVSLIVSMPALPASGDGCNFGFLLPDRIKECLHASKVKDQTNENNTDIKEDNEDEYDDNYYDTHNNTIPETNDNIVSFQIVGDIYSEEDYKEEECVGSLKLLDGEDVEVSEDISCHLGRLDFKVKGVETVRVEGNCCFRVASRRYLRGATQDFYTPGDYNIVIVILNIK